MNTNTDKTIDWEERRFEILKALIAGSTVNLRNSEAINSLISASKNIIERYRNSIKN